MYSHLQGVDWEEAGCGGVAAGGGADQRGVVGAELVPAGAAVTPALEIPARQQLGPPPEHTTKQSILVVQRPVRPHMKF